MEETKMLMMLRGSRIAAAIAHQQHGARANLRFASLEAQDPMLVEKLYDNLEEKHHRLEGTIVEADEKAYRALAQRFSSNKNVSVAYERAITWVQEHDAQRQQHLIFDPIGFGLHKRHEWSGWLDDCLELLATGGHYVTLGLSERSTLYGPVREMSKLYPGTCDRESLPGAPAIAALLKRKSQSYTTVDVELPLRGQGIAGVVAGCYHFDLADVRHALKPQQVSLLVETIFFVRPGSDGRTYDLQRYETPELEPALSR